MILPFKIAITAFVLFVFCLYEAVVRNYNHPYRDSPGWLDFVGGVSLLVAVVATIWGIWV